MSQREGRKVGEGVKFQRTRRICGYLVGTIDRWNNAKLKELADRVKHNTGESAWMDGQTN